MKMKRAPLMGAIGIILIIILFLTSIGTAMHFKNKCKKLAANNELLNVTINEQTTAIDELNAEKSNLTTQISQLEEKIKQLENQTKPTETKTAPQQNIYQSQTSTPAKSTSLGQFKITAYCGCSKCCGKWSGGPTASGVMPTAGRTVAVDPQVIPLGSQVIINGHTYVAEDTGSAIKGNRIDLYFSSHQEALNYGVQYTNVNIIS